MEKLDAADEDFIPDDANRKEPLENIGKKNRKDPPKKIEERNSNAIIPPADMKSKSKSNNGYSNGIVSAILSLPFLVDEVGDKEPKRKAFVAINYSPIIGCIGMYIHYFSFQCFVNVMHQLTIVFMFIVFMFYMYSFLHQIHIIHEFVCISVCQVDTWNDFFDEDGNKLNIGQLKYETKHGKFFPSYIHLVSARNVKSALALVVRLFLEHFKVTENSSMLQDSAMLLLKETSNTDVFHSNSFGKVNANFARVVIDFLSMLLLFDAYSDHNANASPTPWAERNYCPSRKTVSTT